MSIERAIEDELDRFVPLVRERGVRPPSLRIRLTRRQAEFLHELLIREVDQQQRSENL